MKIGSVTTTIKKISVKLVNTVFKAISFGVFWRAAPSTKEIILSINDSPGLLVMIIVISSLTTIVPPVTEQKSPPASFITGADSPVIADSSTDANPFMTSPSLGIISPCFTITTSPFLRSVAET